MGCSAHTQLSAARLRPHFPQELLHNREPTGGPGTQRPGTERDLGSIQAMSAAQPPILKSLLLSSQLYPTTRSPPDFRVIGPLYPPPTCDPSPRCPPVGNSEALFLPHCRSSRETLEIKARPHPSSPSVSGRKLQVSWPGRPKSSTSSTWRPYAFQTPLSSPYSVCCHHKCCGSTSGPLCWLGPQAGCSSLRSLYSTVPGPGRGPLPPSIPPFSTVLVSMRSTLSCQSSPLECRPRLGAPHCSLPLF